ncbi:MAG: hypothetical protein JNM07_06705 [Phycisphaerae bacterium]|nr:hypothetical protein [Phycisphaerae bacterium]
MFGKLCALIVALGVGACLLLAARQMRLQAVNALAETHTRLAEHDRSLARIRTQIAARATPDQVAALAAKLGPLQPMLFDGPSAESQFADALPSGKPVPAHAPSQAETR